MALPKVILDQDPVVMKQNDTSPSYAVVLSDATGWVDLEDAEKVKFLLRSESADDGEAPAVSGEMTFSKEKIPDPENPEGPEIEVWVAVYDWAPGDLDLDAGVFNIEHEVTWAPGNVETFPADEDQEYLKLKLLEDLG